MSDCRHAIYASCLFKEIDLTDPSEVGGIIPMQKEADLKLRKFITRFYILSVIFLLIENGSTYLGLTKKEGLVEVGPSIFFISNFGLAWGVVIAFSLTFSFATLLFILSRVSLKRHDEQTHLLSRWFGITTLFRHSFRYLTALCFGLLASAYNDSCAALFGYAPLGALPELTRYLVCTAIILFGFIYGWVLERQLRPN